MKFGRLSFAYPLKLGFYFICRRNRIAMLSMLSACILLVTSITVFSMTSAATIASSSGNANSCHEIASNLIKMNKDLIQAVFYAKFF